MALCLASQPSVRNSAGLAPGDQITFRRVSPVRKRFVNHFETYILPDASHHFSFGAGQCDIQKIRINAHDCLCNGTCHHFVYNRSQIERAMGLHMA